MGIMEWLDRTEVDDIVRATRARLQGTDSGHRAGLVHHPSPKPTAYDAANDSASTRCTNEIAIEPSPTADATRLTLPHRTSPTANTHGREVSSRYGERSSGHWAAARSCCVRSGPVLMKPFSSSATTPFSQAVFASAPVIRNTCLIS